MRLFRTKKSSHVPTARFRPSLEALDGRLVPALLNPAGGRWVDNAGNLVVNTSSGADGFDVVDNGSAGVGNISVRGKTAADRADPLLRGLNDELAVRHAASVIWVDGGGTNRIEYRAGDIPTDAAGNVVAGPVVAVNPSVGLVFYFGAQAAPANGEDHFTAELTGLARNQEMNVTAFGGVGNDTLQVHAGGRYQGGSQLNVTMAGQLGWDVVGVNAWNPGASMDAGSTMRVNLAANTSGSVDDPADADSNVSFWYLGRMDGTLQYDLAGSGGKDWVSANLWLNAGSTGAVGDGTATGARVRGGAGDDDLQHIVRGERNPPPGRRAVSYNNLTIDGGTGRDAGLFAQTPPPGATVAVVRDASGAETVEVKRNDAIG